MSHQQGFRLGIKLANEMQRTAVELNTTKSVLYRKLIHNFLGLDDKEKTKHVRRDQFRYEQTINERWAQQGFYIGEDMRRNLRYAAIKCGLSVGQLIRSLIRLYLRDNES